MQLQTFRFTVRDMESAVFSSLKRNIPAAADTASGEGNKFALVAHAGDHHYHDKGGHKTLLPVLEAQVSILCN